ncbi:MAG: 16S rRNA (guanine(966)-N(2))-methyltransferase RsmD [Eggerthellaceae bacterium]|nr:16S rRNA (guanine(966)-N(2))-methyltransferase RsmD [Eggerthellaceae bacterium]
MRIISGKYGKRFIEAPKGLDVRPTTERVREALFSSLYSILGSFEDLSVLDAFAGTGSLGIEALSRGAAHCSFCEHDRRVFKYLERNLHGLKIPTSCYKIFQCDVLKNPAILIPSRLFHLIYLDPPYSLDVQQVMEFCNSLCHAGLIDLKNLFVYEHSSTSPHEEILAQIENNFHELVKSNKIATTTYEIFSA